jgi:peptidoglycan/xylan/chitin deacetylase (PgdA/CDA1 family)
MPLTHRAAIVCLLISLVLQGCAPAPTIKAATPTSSAEPLLPTGTEPARTATVRVTITPANTNTPEPSATSTLVPEAIRETPATLMLHRKNYKFDALQFVSDFINALQQTDLQVTTYRELTTKPNLSQEKKGKLFIFTIDDIYLRYPIDPSVQEMIRLLRKAGYPAVLGIITEGDYSDPATVKTLKELQILGWEIASHSDTHRNLADVEKVAPKSIYPEIKASLDKIETLLGMRPVTLILPEGQMTRGDQQIKRSGVRWVVGIGGGNQYDTTRAYYYVGREGPDGSAQETLAIMLKRFSP